MRPHFDSIQQSIRINPDFFVPLLRFARPAREVVFKLTIKYIHK